MAYNNKNNTALSSSAVFGASIILPLLPILAHAQQAPVDVGNLPAMTQPQFDHWNLQAQDNDELYIPPAADRPLSEDDGPRIQVTDLQLDIDTALSRKMDASLSESLRLMLSGRVAENLASGFTIGRLENTASDVTSSFRAAGFILAYAYLPEQNVDNGTVHIKVLPGSLDSVTVDGNNRYSTQRLLGPFTDLMGSPVDKKSIENSIMHLRDYPGLNTTAVFSPGSATGTSELTLRVTEDPFDIAFVADNYGTRSTGETRLRSDLNFYNIFGRADQLTAVILQTFDPSSNTYGGIAYETPIFRHDWSFGLAYSKNSFDVTGGSITALQLGGETDIATSFIRKTLKRTRRAKVDLGLDLNVKKAKLVNTPVPQEDNLSLVGLNFTVEAVDSVGAGGINQLHLRYAQGLDDFLGSMDSNGVSSNGALATRLSGSGTRAGGDFSKATLRYQRLQRVSQSNSILLRFEGQESSDLLVSLEQFVIGGPNSVRAYPIAEYLMDKGIFGSFEWIIDLDSLFGKSGSGTNVALSGFYDYASGDLNDPGPGQIPDIDISGAGVGFTISRTGRNGNQFSLRLDAATAISDETPSNDRDPQYFGMISYSFR